MTIGLRAGLRYTVMGWWYAGPRSNISATLLVEGRVLDAFCLQLADLILQYCCLDLFEATCLQLVDLAVYRCFLSLVAADTIDGGCLRSCAVVSFKLPLLNAVCERETYR